MYLVHRRHLRNRVDFDLTHLIVTKSAADANDEQLAASKQHGRVR
jgi:hypothetical protein